MAKPKASPAKAPLKAPAKAWRKGRGALGPLDPLLGRWVAEAESPLGKVRCTRAFVAGPGSAYVTLTARWEFPEASAAKAYDEVCLFGKGDRKDLGFWSFTSDGKRSEGHLADATDVHPDAVGFEAQMDAGLARQVYWPADDGGVRWAVEAKRKKGWSRFTEHLYHRASERA